MRAALATDATLRREHDALADTIRLLHGMRDAENIDVDSVDDVPDFSARVLTALQKPTPTSTSVRKPRWSTRVTERVQLAAAVSAVVLLVVGVAVVGGSSRDKAGGAVGVAAAGFGAVHAATATWMAIGLDAGDVATLAAREKLHVSLTGHDVHVSGEGAAMERFVYNLKMWAAGEGREVSGMLPSADEWEIIVKTE
jgi:hypothetical protein